MTNMTNKQMMDWLAYSWRMQERAKLAEEREKAGLPPKKYKAKAQLTKSEKQVVVSALKHARNKGHWGDFFAGPYGDTEVNVIDSEFQKLDIRVGPVFQGNKMSKVPGIWIAYQERAWLSTRQGDFLMSPTTFFEIVEDALEKIASFNPGAYKLTRERITARLNKARRKRQK